MGAFGRMIDYYDIFYRIYMRLYKYVQPTQQAATVFGVKVTCTIADFIQRRIAFFGLFEPNLTYFTTKLLKPGDVYIDVGANIGYFSMLAAKCVGLEGKVYAIEASSSTYRLLVDNLALNALTNVEAINMAVADRECRVQIRSVDARNIGANKVEQVGDNAPDSVPGRPLPAIVGEDFSRARIIKMDVEGAEGAILPGLLDAIADADSRAILVVEISRENAHLVDLARRLGFNVRAIPNNYSIGHLLIRQFLRRTHEDEFYVLNRVDKYVPGCDYVFFRHEVAVPL